MKINKGNLISRLAILCAVLFVMNMCVGFVKYCVSFVKYPEQYSTTWKYQLENELASGNEEMLEYYNRNYVAKGKRLFGDNYIVKNGLQ